MYLILKRFYAIEVYCQWTVYGSRIHNPHEIASFAKTKRTNS